MEPLSSLNTIESMSKPKIFKKETEKYGDDHDNRYMNHSLLFGEIRKYLVTKTVSLSNMSFYSFLHPVSVTPSDQRGQSVVNIFCVTFHVLYKTYPDLQVFVFIPHHEGYRWEFIGKFFFNE